MAIYKNFCPKCKKINMVNNGDETDLTKMDVEAVQCYNCNHKWVLEGSEDFVTLEEAELVMGEKEGM